MYYLKKLFNSAPSLEEQKEIQMISLQLEKLIKRAVDNADEAIAFFDKGNLGEEDTDELADKVSTGVNFMLTHFRVEENGRLLSEIEEILINKKLRAFSFIRDELKKAKQKNFDASIALGIDPSTLGEADLKMDAAMHLIGYVSATRRTRDALVSAAISVKDLYDLFIRQFSTISFEYVNKKRIDELRSIQSDDFDLSKLVSLCEELNGNFQNQNYLSVAMLVRAILDHVPPIFGFKTFIEVASNYGGKSLKKSIQNLQNSSRNISDAYLHETIKRKESLPNETQIDFRNDLDVLLSEVVRILK